MNLKVEKEILGILKLVNEKEKLALHEPVFIGKEIAYLNDCINSGFVSSVGNYVNLFSNKLQTFTKAKYIIPVVSGTSALHIALKVADVMPEEEVLIPSLSFVATANAVCYCNAIPHFVDIDKKTLGLDPLKLKNHLKNISKTKSGRLVNKFSDRIISSIIVMHTFGHSCDLDEIKNIANEFGLKLIEDSAESLGTFYKNKHTGNFGELGVLSFNGNKIITTGGGGAIMTNDKLLADKALHLTTTAKVKHNWEYIHDEVGYNYRMPNLNAALGCAQLENIELFISKKRDLFKKYKLAFSEIDYLEVFEESKYSKSNYWLNSIILSENMKHKKNSIIEYTNKNNVRTRPAWKLLNTLKPFLKFPKSDLSNSEAIYDSVINIPSTPLI